MSEQVLTAFGILLETLNEEKPQLAGAVHEAIMQSKVDEAHKLIDKIQGIEQLIEQVQKLKEMWLLLYGVTIEISSHINDNDTSKDRQTPKNEHGLIGEKIPLGEMYDKVNAYKRYERLFFVISAVHLNKFRETLGITSTRGQFVIFRKEHTLHGEKYRFEKTDKANLFL